MMWVILVNGVMGVVFGMVSLSFFGLPSLFLLVLVNFVRWDADHVEE